MSIYDGFFSIAAYIIRQKKIPSLISPKTLTDKVLLLKLKQKHRLSYLRILAADRVKVRKYISEKKSDVKLIKVLWSGLHFSKEIWDSLPDKFVIKANHGSKMVRIIDKEEISYDDIYAETERWKNTDYYKKGREWVYKNIERTLVVEEFLEFDNDVPPDFKFFCLNGTVEFVQVDLDRFNQHTRNIYDRNFEKLDIKYQFPNGYDINKPKLYDRALKIAEELSSDFDFIRVDLYILDDEVYFGELTNFPGNCLEKFYPNSFDLYTGEKLIIE